MNNNEKYELIAQYLLDSEENRAIGCNEYTQLIQMINRQLNLYGRDLEQNELSFLTTILSISLREKDYFKEYTQLDANLIVIAINKILKAYEDLISEDDITITKFLEYLKEMK